jgi:IS5 family transposase
VRRRRSQLTGYATRDWRKGGKPSFDPVLMFTVPVLQKFHGLSDDATEEQIFDRTSFKNFLGLRIGGVIPDAKTIRDFKQRLEADGCEGSRKLFEAFNLQLESKGVTASFTEAPRQRNDRNRTSASRTAGGPRSSTPTLPWVGRKTAKSVGRRRTTKPTMAGRTM